MNLEDEIPEDHEVQTIPKHQAHQVENRYSSLESRNSEFRNH